ncbi:MAG: hypothetical protein COB02_07760 [Candidatus Cloacimonadota bacterium]|nr:MAG: hypothetical protein COB02_07760 [Candidatus Cloacimonadota bacterium]
MNGFFENLITERKLRQEIRHTLSEDSKLNLEENLFVELLYSTVLNWDNLLNITREEAINYLTKKSSNDLPHLSHLTNARLVKFLKASEGSFLFSSRFRSKTSKEVLKLLASNLEFDFVTELKNTRVLKSTSEYEILPTPLRLDVDPSYTGKGVTIAFLDGGFYPHPDLMKPSRRVVAYKDLGAPHRPKSDFEKPDHRSWHGMQTCVSAVGNGYLSKGLYKGIAYESDVALLKVAGDEGFSTESIVAGIEWCIRKRKRYNIRVLNISLGVNGSGSFRESIINHAAEEAVQSGINVVVAAGNESWSEITPPGNSPSVITVGGLDDRNSLDQKDFGMYHSSFGKTYDGVMKPEIIAPGIWVAAPTLPGTFFYREAEFVWKLSQAKSLYHLKEILNSFEGSLDYLEDLKRMPFQDCMGFISHKIKEFKLISPYYQHVDGTSFSAPIVCSIIAQILEANSKLTPKNVKEILMESAQRLDNVAVEKQGCGVVQARAAVALAVQKSVSVGFEYPEIKENTVKLIYIKKEARTVEVAGSFNDWKSGEYFLKKNKQDVFEIDIALPTQGTWEYKFLIDGETWVDDSLNSTKHYDGYGGFNSVVHLHGTKKTKNQLLSLAKSLNSIKSIKKESTLHRKLLSELDQVFSYENIARSPLVLEFYEDRIKKVIHHIKTRKVENGVFLYQLYNCGYILQTPTLTIGIDIVSGKHVWDVFWNTNQEIFSELVSLLDIAFVSHRLPDHLDLDIVNKMIEQDKLVVVPSEMENLCLNGVIGFEPGESRNLYSLGSQNMSLNIDALPGLYRMSSAKDIDLRCYKMSLHEKFNILHLSDHEINTPLHSIGLNSKDQLGDVHVLLAPLPVTDDEAVIQNWLDAVDRIDPDILIPIGLAELGQKNNLDRSLYQRAFKILERTNRGFEVLAWGDSIKIGHL